MPSPRGSGRIHGRVPAAVLAALAAAGLLALVSPAEAPAKATAATAAPAAQGVRARLQQRLERLVRAHPSFPGAVLAVRTPRFAWAGGAGVARRGSRAPLEPEATFRVASMTKTFTAAAILRLAEDGRLSIEDPISRYLDPATSALLRDGGYDPDAIRVTHLLQHTSGLAGDYSQLPAYLEFIVGHPRHRWTRAEQVVFVMTHSRPLSAPGAEIHYSDTGYVLLGEMLERVTGGGLAEAYRSLLPFARLGLDATYLETLEPRAPAARPRVHQYFGAIDTTRFDPSFDIYGAGGHVSTVGDLLRFYRGLVGGRVFEQPSTLTTMLTSHMGIDEAPFPGETCFGHGGFWGVVTYHCPRSGVTIAAMINQAEGFAAPISRLVLAAHRLARPRG